MPIRAQGTGIRRAHESKTDEAPHTPPSVIILVGVGSAYVEDGLLTVRIGPSVGPWRRE